GMGKRSLGLACMGCFRGVFSSLSYRISFFRVALVAARGWLPIPFTMLSWLIPACKLFMHFDISP
ncbi:hypothetical protein K523DRAFT_228299, partial [Schizophyllum commune Tattone D]